VRHDAMPARSPSVERNETLATLNGRKSHDVTIGAVGVRRGRKRPGLMMG
jgi:hypothetical protein